MDDVNLIKTKSFTLSNMIRQKFKINKVLTSARNNSTIAVFVAHDINTGGKLSVSVATLKMIARFVKVNNLTSYTASEISQ